MELTREQVIEYNWDGEHGYSGPDQFLDSWLLCQSIYGQFWLNYGIFGP